MNIDYFKKINDSLGDCWDGKASIIRMRADDYQWKQMEWPAFYFQYLVKLNNDNSFLIPGKTINNTTFDTHWLETDIPIDVKFHSNKNDKGQHNHIAPLNDVEAIKIAIDTYGTFGLLIACGDNEYDHTGEFKIWHDTLKEKKSKYVLEGEAIGRKSRMRKVFTKLTHLHYYQIDNIDVLSDGFQKGMKNSDGSSRKEKYTLNTLHVKPLYTITR